MEDQIDRRLLLIPLLVASMWIYDKFTELHPLQKLFAAFILVAAVLAASTLFLYFYSSWGRNRRKLLERLKEVPTELLNSAGSCARLGTDSELNADIFLPDQLRSRHVHIIGATGSGKTESVVLNLLRQDVGRGLGSIILDAKGDNSFLAELNSWVPSDRLRVFDLGSPSSLGYDPLSAGTPLESAQRLFSALTWSEEYYKSKALSALQRIFQVHFETNDRNPQLVDIERYLSSSQVYSAFVNSVPLSNNLAEREFQDLAGLRDQIRSLTLGHFAKTLSPEQANSISLGDVRSGQVIYFRLQSLMSPQLATTVGKLVINHLAFLAGTAHRDTVNKVFPLTPIYFDEFASFACVEFADLISKARSAGFALHFSHQSIGDVIEISPGFLNRITDNAATKIVLRINDPDSAEFFARCFGTKQVQKTTQRITNAKDIESAEVVGEGTTRDAHQFRASPDLFKTLPTGVGVVLIAHGRETPHGGSSVFKIRFPRLERLATVKPVLN